MKVTELIHNAIDGIILSQLLEYVAGTKITKICLLALSLCFVWSKCNCSHLSKFASNAGKG